MTFQAKRIAFRITLGVALAATQAWASASEEHPPVIDVCEALIGLARTEYTASKALETPAQDLERRLFVAASSEIAIARRDLIKAAEDEVLKQIASDEVSGNASSDVGYTVVRSLGESFKARAETVCRYLGPSLLERKASCAETFPKLEKKRLACEASPPGAKVESCVSRLINFEIDIEAYGEDFAAYMPSRIRSLSLPDRSWEDLVLEARREALRENGRFGTSALNAEDVMKVHGIGVDDYVQARLPLDCAQRFKEHAKLSQQNEEVPSQAAIGTDRHDKMTLSDYPASIEGDGPAPEGGKASQAKEIYFPSSI